MVRNRLLWCGAIALVIAGASQLFGQTVNPDQVPGPIGTAGGVFPNTFQAGQPVIPANKVVQPMPLTPGERDAALEGIDRHIAEDIAALKAKLKAVLPDELAILT